MQHIIHNGLYIRHAFIGITFSNTAPGSRTIVTGIFGVVIYYQLSKNDTVLYVPVTGF